jgi:membrane dipeptidase
MTASAFVLRSAWAVDALDPRVAGIVAKTIGIDTHNHIDLPLTTEAMPGPDIDLIGEMKRSGLSAICATFATDYQKGDSYERYKNWFTSMDRQLERNGMKRSLTAEDIRTAHHNGKSAVIQSIEGSHFLEGKLERVEEAYHRGVRHLGLLHDSDASVPLGDVYTNPPRFGGLTPFGASVVKECNRLGILVDLEHADTKTTADAIKISTRPVVCSHTGLDTRLGNDPRMAQMMRPRLISKEQATLVAKADGVIGVWVHLSDTPLAYAQNIRAMVDVVGVDHVSLGTDTKLTQPTPRPGQPKDFRPGQMHEQIGERTNMAWANETVGFYYTVVDALLKTGFSPDEIGKIGGGNYLRVFSAAVG